MIPALHNAQWFAQTVAKWKELGILDAVDIMSNGKTPTDYNLRIGENNVKSAFGQVDKDSRMQGLGREVYDHLYEGQFKNNVYHGWGRFINHKGVYWGFWENGLRHGQGKFMGANGQALEGNWVKGGLQ